MCFLRDRGDVVEDLVIHNEKAADKLSRTRIGDWAKAFPGSPWLS